MAAAVRIITVKTIILELRRRLVSQSVCHAAVEIPCAVIFVSTGFCFCIPHPCINFPLPFCKFRLGRRIDAHGKRRCSRQNRHCLFHIFFLPHSNQLNLFHYNINILVLLKRRFPLCSYSKVLSFGKGVCKECRGIIRNKNLSNLNNRLNILFSTLL